jgi:methionyl aminopeptidase
MSLRKTPQELATIRIAGKYLAEVIASASRAAQPGIVLRELDLHIANEIAARDCIPSFLKFQGFPANSCLSLNEQVVHGIPDGRVLKEGDVLGIDVGLWYKNLCVDSATTIGIGTISNEATRLLTATQKALQQGIAAIRPGRRVGAISYSVQNIAEEANLGIVRALTGHGVGHDIWEAPSIPNYGRATDGMLLRAGMVLAIEPMLTLGSGEVLTEIDGWGIVTADSSLAAQFEHTVIVTEHGAEIVT